jgi:glutathione S-transferase
MTDALVLYGDSKRESPYVFSCFVALREKGVAFELQTLSLAAGEHRSPDYASRSITGRVPSLRHGDFWLAESSAIDEYLEEAFPPPAYPAIYPATARERGRARQVQAWLRSDLMPIREERPTSSVFGPRTSAPLSASGRAAAERFLAGCEALLPPGAAHLFGAFTIADADLALFIQRLALNGDAVPDRLRAYADAIWRRPSVREWLDAARG